MAIDNISDTARWVAVYRAQPVARPIFIMELKQLWRGYGPFTMTIKDLILSTLMRRIQPSRIKLRQITCLAGLLIWNTAALWNQGFTLCD